uniref:Pre-mRNA-processing factor 17 n=1 Tax=Timema cristinae TaxID=61476 RepID=A0A7R9H2I0_TIMCR|nr:unnamed protein product [Timema cristinae]
MHTKTSRLGFKSLLGVLRGAVDSLRHIDATTLELKYNPKYEELFAPELGPVNPFHTQQQKAQTNMLSGFVEKAHISDFQFENQRRTFNSFGCSMSEEQSARYAQAVHMSEEQSARYAQFVLLVLSNLLGMHSCSISDVWCAKIGVMSDVRVLQHAHTLTRSLKTAVVPGTSLARYALDPTVDAVPETSAITPFIGATETAKETDGKTVFESTKERLLDKRKRNKNDDPGNIGGFLGPWGGYVDEQRIMKPSEEEAVELEEILAKRQKRGKQAEDKPLEEKTVLHIKDAVDYQGRSFLHAPQDVGVNLKSDSPPERCFLPKAQIHTWQGHTKGISAIRWFPKTAHLLLSCSMDCRVKLWEVYNERRCVRTYYGHRQAVRDISFNNLGTQFLSAAYDRYIKLWDTETGECISRFTSRKIPYCAKFHPDEEKQHLFVAGTSDKKIICWDVRSGEIVQEYDRHLGAVNSITFVDENRRFVTTSDDKSLRVWEWDIPVDMKYIADPTMHSMPAVMLSPNQKWLACQSMDNKIVIFSALNRFKMNRKKTFSGHMVAGYACTLDFSPDMSYLMSGDADGKCYIWDWKTTKLYKKWKAHDSVCIGVLWHPHESSKVVTAGWDGLLKFWD